MTQGVVAYVHKGCKTSQRALDVLERHGAAYVKRELFEETPTKDDLRHFLKAMDLPARRLLRPRDRLYRERNLKEADLPEEELLDLMVAHPGLIRRPILVRGEAVALALKPEDVETFLRETE